VVIRMQRSFFVLAVFPRSVALGCATGVAQGTPVSPGMREGMLFGMWVPWQGSFVGAAAFMALAQLEMASHVSDGNVKLVAYLFAFLAAVASAAVLVSSAVALFGLRAKVRRDKQRQAEAD
jgi:hypothetical protein